MRILTLLLVMMFFAMGCDKRCVLPPQIIGTGEIIPNALVVSQTYTTWEMTSKEHVIKADSQNVYNLKVSFDNGSTYVPIDFNQYTLLGKHASGGCQVVFERNVTKDDVQKKYFYRIKVHQCGTCKKYMESMNWVLVPRIPDDYTVSFIVEEK